MNKNNCNNYHPHSKLIFILLGILLLVACDSNSRINGITISSSPDINVVENRTDTIHTVETQDQPFRPGLASYTLTGGADQSHFNINKFTGELSFKTPQDFEAPTDSDNNNTYQVEITVSDNVNTAMQPLTVTVSDEFDFRIASTDLKTIEFAWTALSTPVGEATFYRLFVNPDGDSGFSLLQDDIVGVSHRINVPVHLTDWVNARYILEAHNSAGPLGITPVIAISQAMLTVIGYFKASNTDAEDQFGGAVSLSSDGTTLAVGARLEASDATDINAADPTQADNSANAAGAVYVFTRSGISWNQQAYIKASNTDSYDQFGSAVSLSSDGATLAVGALGDDSADNTADRAGAVYVFTRSDISWSQQAYIKASNASENDRFGSEVSLSSDGATLAVGSRSEDGTDSSTPGAGAVYVFTRSDVSWRQQAYIKASNTDANDQFGSAVSLSSDGATLAVGAYREESIATGVNPADSAQADNTAENAGAVYVFTRSDVSWRQQAYIKASNTDANDRFGSAVSLNSDGTTLAVGALFEGSNARNINAADPAQADNSASNAGAVYIY